jgi:hypothetical protein
MSSAFFTMELNAKKSAKYFEGIKDYNYKSPYTKWEINSSGQRECTINWKKEIKKIGGREKNPKL